LDEPFVGLDPMGIELVKEKLLSLCRDAKVSIIFSSHQLTEVAEISDDIVILNSGKVGYCGTYSQLINDTKMYHVFLRRDAPPNFLQKLGVMTKDNRRELHFKHSESILDEVLREVCNIGLGIENITIADNSLLGLFSD
jgi:ABC-2 type transport system ATP-binding protein